MKQSNFKNYLLQSIDFTGYGLENTVENVFNTCKSEYSHISNDYTRTRERLLGLPSCLNVVFSYYEISELMKSFGYKTQDTFKLNDMYWNNLTKAILNNR